MHSLGQDAERRKAKTEWREMDRRWPEGRQSRSSALWIAAAAVSGGVSVIAGAFAAHGLDAQTDADAIGWLRTGSQYEALHALAMLAVCALENRIEKRWANIALWLFLVGSALFPGALYGLALHGPRWLGALAPIGGTAFILGWLALAAAALRKTEARGK
jgi:uncharacterized membrane protein YgdD (TMEM256/DUF423 family)